MASDSAAQQLTDSSDLSSQASELKQLFSFISNGQEYAVDILRIQEIRGWTGVRYMPKLPSYIKGVIDLRGQIVPIIDFRERLGMPSVPYNSLSVVVVIRVLTEKGDRTLGLVVDAVSEVYDINPTMMHATPDMGAGIHTDYVQALLTVDEKMVIILCPDKLLSGNLPERIESKVDLKEYAAAQTDETSLLEQSFALLAPKADKLVARFYTELFKRYPDVKPLFEATQPEEQQKKLIAALQLVMANLRKPDALQNALRELGKKHQHYGAIEAHYDAVAEVLLDVMKDMALDAWTVPVAQAWQNALTTIKTVMLSGYESTEKTASDVELIESSFKLLAPKADELAKRFYERLFQTYPAVKPLFNNVNLDKQRGKLIAAIKLVVESIRDPDKLEQILVPLGKSHQAYGATAEHYDAVANTLLKVLQEFAGTAWNSALHNAWQGALGSVKNMMLQGYEAGVTKQQIESIEYSFDILAPKADELVAKFYGRLFQRYPEVKSMFANANPKDQKQKLIAALQLVVNNLRNPRKLKYILLDLGKRHQDYGALPAHYDVVADLMLEVMQELAGRLWSAEIQKAWQTALNQVRDMMLEGYH